MDVTEFVEAIRLTVEQPSINDCINSYEDPPGRKPSKELLEISNWYKSMSEQDREMLRKVLADAVGSSIFGFFCVLDGVRAIEDSPEKGELELWHVKNGQRTLINGSEQNLLHDEYSAV
jgi:hypothetical protein